MKRYIKTIIGILVIALAAGSMYMWNEKGREKAELTKAELEAAVKAEEAKDPYEDIYKAGKSFFPIPKSWISSYSTKLSSGNSVDIYYKKVTVNDENNADNDIEITLFGTKKQYQEYEAEYFGKYNVSGLADDSIEIICTLKDFTDMENLVKDEDNKLIFVMGAKYD